MANQLTFQLIDLGIQHTHLHGKHGFEFFGTLTNVVHIDGQRPMTAVNTVAVDYGRLSLFIQVKTMPMSF